MGKPPPEAQQRRRDYNREYQRARRRAGRKRENRVPEREADVTTALYDPRRDGYLSPVDLTAGLMGDPPPGRRELVERNRRT